MAAPSTEPDALWARVDEYVERLVLPEDPVLEETLRTSRQAGLPDIQVSPLQGQFLHLLARSLGARRILEVGTLGGYSAICLGRALPPRGHLLSLELREEHARVARANLRRAGLLDRVEVRVGPASESLQGLLRAKVAPFDLVFIDADKPSTADYLRAALRLTRVGSVIVVDNVVRGGKVVEKDHPEAAVQGIRRFNEVLAREPRLLATEIQTVGAKGHDGFAFALVVAEGRRRPPAERRPKGSR